MRVAGGCAVSAGVLALASCASLSGLSGGGGGADSGADGQGVPQRDATAGDGRAGDAYGGDGGIADVASPDGAGSPSDAPVADVADTGPSDAASSDGDGGCGSPDPTSAFVDGLAAPGGNGTAACPFQTIHEGVSAVSGAAGTGVATTVTVAAGAYSEQDLVIPSRVAVTGTAGSASTTLSGTATKNCLTAGQSCVVSLQRGAALDGFTITTTGTGTYEGVVGDVAAADGLAPPTVRNLAVGPIAGSGIHALGSMSVGPGVSASQNQGYGLYSTGAGVVHVVAGAVTNHFDGNGEHGIYASGAAQLLFDGGTASANGREGIYLSGAGGVATTTAHAITGLVAANNGDAGVYVGVLSQAVYVTMRQCTLLGNLAAGLVYMYPPPGGAAANPLDLGTATSPGANVFGVPQGTAGAASMGAGILVCGSPVAGSLTAASDTFARCPPSSVAITACSPRSGPYADIAYVPASAGNGDPLVAPSCSVVP